MENTEQDNFSGSSEMTWRESDSAFTTPTPTAALSISFGAKFEGYIKSDENGVTIGPCPHCGHLAVPYEEKV